MIILNILMTSEILSGTRRSGLTKNEIAFIYLNNHRNPFQKFYVIKNSQVDLLPDLLNHLPSFFEIQVTENNLTCVSIKAGILYGKLNQDCVAFMIKIFFCSFTGSIMSTKGCLK